MRNTLLVNIHGRDAMGDTDYAEHERVHREAIGEAMPDGQEATNGAQFCRLRALCSSPLSRNAIGAMTVLVDAEWFP